MDVNVDRVPATPLSLRVACEYFEKQYGISSSTFYSRYMKGEFLDIHDAIRWAGYWRAYLRATDDKLSQKGISGELLSAVG